MEAFVQRMCDESKELSSIIDTMNSRLFRLTEFMEGAAFKNFDETIKKLMNIQKQAMEDSISSLKCYQMSVDARISIALRNNINSLDEVVKLS